MRVLHCVLLVAPVLAHTCARASSTPHSIHCSLLRRRAAKVLSCLCFRRRKAKLASGNLLTIWDWVSDTLFFALVVQYIVFELSNPNVVDFNRTSFSYNALFTYNVSGAFRAGDCKHGAFLLFLCCCNV